MKNRFPLVLSLVLFIFSKGLFAQNNPSVTIKDTGDSYILSNGYLSLKIDKRTADLISVKTPNTITPNTELMGYVSGHHAGYWEQSPALASRRVAGISIDPKNNDGQRGEVFVKGYSDGKSILGKNPTAAGQAGGLIADLEIRYTLERGAKGLYTYAIFTHQDSYPAGSVGESRFGFKLSGKVFDWMSIDEQRNGLMPTGKDWDEGEDLNMKEARRLITGNFKGKAEHKYDYSAKQSKIPAYGWSSTKEKVGIYMINPSFEYLSSGPNHFELTGHLDNGDGADPTLLNYWRGTHYGGSVLNFNENEYWTKVVGPMFVYIPTGASPNTMFAEAKKQAKIEQLKWPYSWVKGVHYAHVAERALVKGKMKLIDPQASQNKFLNLLVGLSFPDQASTLRPMRNTQTDASIPAQIQAPINTQASPRRDTLPNGKLANRGTYLPPNQPTRPQNNFQPAVNWQNDAKHYQFWTEAAADGTFIIPNIRPGIYQLHAVADGILGAYDATTTLTIKAGEKIDLGTLDWKPVRYGKQIFEIGTPNRSAKEFFKGDDHWHWGMYIEYAKLFPNDVNFTVGKSDPAKDWYIYHVPHDIEFKPDGRDQGHAAPWNINFNMPENATPNKKAILRFGIAGSGARSLSIKVNGDEVGPFTDLAGGGAIMIRDGIEGTWVEKKFEFDASLLKKGKNTITLTVPAGGVANGLCYDVIRLELEK